MCDTVPTEGQSFFCNTSCGYFPCHEGIPAEEFNCLFCYCPLYTLGPRCGGNYTYTASGIKDCSRCTLLHKGDKGARIVRERFSLLADLARLPKNVTNTDPGPGGTVPFGPLRQCPCEPEQEKWSKGDSPSWTILWEQSTDGSSS